MSKSAVNKGSYFFDSEERIAEFNARRAYKNEEAYYEYRSNWSKFPETRFVSEYPLSVEFNISNACNLKCPYCFRQTEDFKKQKRINFMDFELFKKVIDEVAFKVPAIRFNCDGEPALHPEIIKMIAYAKSHGAIEVSSITNLGVIDEKMFIEMMNAGLDWLTVSVDGLDEDYEYNRYPLKFKETYNKLKRFLELREQACSKKPAINVQAVWPSIEKYHERFYKVMSEVCDAVSYNAMIDFEAIYERKGKHNYDPEFRCAQVYQRIWIGNPNGDVYLCCAPGAKPVGNVNETTIYEIWHSERMNTIRQNLAEPMGFQKLNECAECPMTIAMRSEEVKIGDRIILVNKYNYCESEKMEETL